MDMGAIICPTKNPQGNICPFRKVCVAYNKNLIDEIPSKKEKKEKKV